MQIYLAAAPAEVRAAAVYGHPLSHAAYRIGQDSTLLRQNLLLQLPSGGLLSVSDRDAPTINDPKELCAAVLRECSRRAYAGVVLDFEEPPRRDRLAFAEQLSPLLAEKQRTLYVPEPYARAAPQATVLIGTALSGGNLKERLQEAAKRYGGRTALDLERLRMSFPLPCPAGLGTPLTPEEFSSLKERETPAVFFSPDLCARYFTYEKNGQTRFILFDDADTLKQKLRLGTSLGYNAAFFVWPEIQDIAEQMWK